VAAWYRPVKFQQSKGRSEEGGSFYVQTIEYGTGQEANEKVHGEGD
jgi:hypothetical protein